LNIKGGTISHMAAVHPGHQLPGALQKEEEEEISVRAMELRYRN